MKSMLVMVVLGLMGCGIKPPSSDYTGTIKLGHGRTHYYIKGEEVSGIDYLIKIVEDYKFEVDRP